MSLPGFTAEASLYKTSERYQITGTVTQAEGTIHLAQGIPPVGGNWPSQPSCTADCLIRCRKYDCQGDPWFCGSWCWGWCGCT